MPQNEIVRQRLVTTVPVEIRTCFSLVESGNDLRTTQSGLIHLDDSLILALNDRSGSVLNNELVGLLQNNRSHSLGKRSHGG